MQQVAAKLWKRLVRLDKLKGCLAEMVVKGAWADITLGIDAALLRPAMLNKRGPADYFFRRIQLQLESTFDREIDIFLVGEIDKKFHLHGAVARMPGRRTSCR